MSVIITGFLPILTHNYLTLLLYCLTLILDPQLFQSLCMICCFPIYYFRSVFTRIKLYSLNKNLYLDELDFVLTSLRFR